MRSVSCGARSSGARAARETRYGELLLIASALSCEVRDLLL
ncbi:hypothetical protein [Streptomyces sp. NRRL F-5630]|nr:hypothetical protein [Streptomyces sp. NRRL F-5630]